MKLVFIAKALKRANNYKNDYTKYVFYVAIFRKKYYLCVSKQPLSKGRFRPKIFHINKYYRLSFTMQDLNALKSKSLSELREIARALGLDVRSGREKLVAKIVGATAYDQEGEAIVDEMVATRRPRKRIQPRMEFSTHLGGQSEEAAAQQELPIEQPSVASEAPATEPAAEEVKPKRRGRPRKNPLPEEVEPAEQTAAPTEPVAEEEAPAEEPTE